MARDTVSTQIPRKWQDPIAAEQAALGCANKIECLNQILETYFTSKGGTTENMAGEAKDEPTQGSGPDVTGLARQIADLSASLTKAQEAAQKWQREAETTGRELEQYQTMEKHPPVPHILTHLETCPSCKPHMDAYLTDFVAKLPADRVKDLAKAHKLWPPPSIDLGPGLTRKARG